jgi:excisionase family DNA binding protein
MKRVFTTGQVAQICRVSPPTVAKWFDSGRLQGYRIPGSRDRRILRESLIRFLKENHMPLGVLEEERELSGIDAEPVESNPETAGWKQTGPLGVVDSDSVAREAFTPAQVPSVSRDDPAVKESFTTAQVARLCKVAPRTVGKWFDSGRLKGFRIQSSGERRVPRDALVRFLQEHGMPLQGLLEDERKETATD